VTEEKMRVMVFGWEESWYDGYVVDSDMAKLRKE